MYKMNSCAQAHIHSHIHIHIFSYICGVILYVDIYVYICMCMYICTYLSISRVHIYIVTYRPTQTFETSKVEGVCNLCADW